MFRELTAASAAVLALGACPFAPQATAADNDQVISVQNGKIRCLLSANYEGRGYAMTICGMANGGPFGISPKVDLNLAAIHGTGEMYWINGPVPGSAGDVVLGTGQTFHSNGWTVKTEELRTLISNDQSGHGLNINPYDARQF